MLARGKMKTMHRNWSELLNDCIIIMLVCGTIGIALKFTTFFDKWVYFPSFPNVLDATFLILSTSYLTWKAKKAHTTKSTKQNKQTTFKKANPTQQQ
jgi:cytochrome c oxidase assembly factor CtaG